MTLGGPELMNELDDKSLDIPVWPYAAKQRVLFVIAALLIFVSVPLTYIGCEQREESPQYHDWFAELAADFKGNGTGLVLGTWAPFVACGSGLLGLLFLAGLSVLF